MQAQELQPTVSVVEAISQVSNEQEANRIGLFRKALNAAGAIISLAGVSGATEAFLASPAAAATATTEAQALKNSNNFSNANTAANLKEYNSDAGLKKASVILKHGQKLNKSTATKFLYGQFSGDGPLGGKGDKQSLAEIYGAIVVPSQRGVSISPSESNGTNANYNYIDGINEALASFSSKNGAKAHEKAASKDEVKIMTEDAAYNSLWAQHGSRVLLIDPIRDKSNNNIIGWQPENIILGENGNKLSSLSGIEFKARNSANPGYQSVLLTSGGEIYIQGVVEQQASANKNSNSSNSGSSTSTGTNKGNTPAGGVTTGGKVNENQTGPAPEINNVAPHPTPGPGNTTTPTTTPPGETTTTTTTPGETTTTTTTPTTTTTTTQPNNNKNPDPCATDPSSPNCSPFTP